MPAKSDSSRRAGRLFSPGIPLLRCRNLLYVVLLHAGLFAHAQSIRDAEALSRAGRFVESSEIFEQFIAQNPRRTYDHSVAWLGISRNNLLLGDYDVALSANYRSKTIREQLPVDDVAENFMQSGAIFLQMGAYEQALIHLNLAKSLPVVEPYWFALMESYIAKAYAGLNDFREAEAHFELALESIEVEAGAFSPDVVVTLIDLAKLYQLQGRNAEAKETLLRALQIENALPEHAERMGLLLLSMGEVVGKESGHLAARSYFLRARAELESVFGTHHPLLANVALHLGRTAHANGDKAQTAAEALEAQRVLYPGFSASDFLQNPGPGMPCLDRIQAAEAYLQKARSHTGIIPVQYFSEAFQLIENEALAYPSADRRIQAKQLLQLVAEEALNAVYQSDSIPLRQYAFVWSERAKAIQMHLETAVPRHPSDGNSTLLFRKWKQAEYQFLQKPETVAHVFDFANAQKAYLESVGQSREEAFLLQPPLSLEAVRPLLADDEALVSYYIGAKAYYIFAFSRKGFQTKAMISWPSNNAPAAPALQRAAQDFFRALSSDLPDSIAIHAADLYNKLILPALPIISGQKKLIIIPHEVLAQLPFEALLAAAPAHVEKKPYSKWPFLIKEFTIKYHLTGNSWATPALTAQNTLAYMAWAPAFDSPETQAVLAKAMYQKLLPAAPLSAYGTPELPQLPESAQEIQSIAPLWSRQPDDARLFLRQEATEVSFRNFSGLTGIAHFATLGFSHPVHPRWSGLVLMPSEDEDGFVYLSDVQRLHWNSALCILSLEAVAPAPVATLPQAFAFIRAGASGILTTLWSGHGSARSRLLNDFLRKRAGGISTADALQQSKLALIKDKTTAGPRHWGGIIYYGK